MSESCTLDESKRAVVTAMLDEGVVLVTVDTTRPGVLVPPACTGPTSLVLRVGYNLRPAIPDLDLGPETLSGTLSFGGAPFLVVLPWASVYAAHGNTLAYWPASAPAGSLASVTEVPMQTPPKVLTPAEIKAAKRAHLKLV